ncbi:MAG: peptidoglycan-binding domain-containing protein [Bacteroidota bacterium]
MKRLFYLVIIITLPLIAFFQFWNFRKFNPPSDYAYEISQEIDPNYHDPEMVKEYFLTCKEVGNYARYVWKEHGVDVKFADPTHPEEKEFASIYNSLIATAQFLEGKLEKSAELKKDGLNNEDVIWWEKGIIERNVADPNLGSSRGGDQGDMDTVAKIGDKNAAVRAIQESLYKKGHKIRIDGIFRQETRDAVLAFQNKKKLPETGIVDLETFQKLTK